MYTVTKIVLTILFVVVEVNLCLSKRTTDFYAIFRYNFFYNFIYTTYVMMLNQKHIIFKQSIRYLEYTILMEAFIN